MRRPRLRQHKRPGGEGARFLGALLLVCGLIILFRLLPVWLLWGIAALLLVGLGVFLLSA